MKIVRNNSELTSFLEGYRVNNPNKSIGFIPTMGALHTGHMSLITEAKKTVNLIACSIFVNPTQFNDSTDLEKYPRTEEADLQLLKQNNCDLVFIPSESDIYPEKTKKYSIDLVGLDKVMEGKYRNGHFDGVCMVVERFFNLVKPDFAFFGKKDFQQVSIIKHMVKVRGFEIDIISCPIKREESGLAMSSRNSLLLPAQKSDATIINETLQSGINSHKNGASYSEVLESMLTTFETGNLKLEYLEVVNNVTLQSVKFIDENTSVCIAAYCGDIRLIDNHQFSNLLAISE